LPRTGCHKRSDAAGVVIASSSLLFGTIVEDPTFGDDCKFKFVVKNVPPTDFYRIEVSHRGQLTFTHDEFEARGWTVDFELGH